ncbi:MAG: vitamin K epoxide reductase family protein [Candidatus Nanopelagicales bacterium]
MFRTKSLVTLLMMSLIGLFASGAIITERINLLKNPGESLSCDLNPLFSCGTVMSSPQANTFGFPNPMLGLVFFGMLLAFVGLAFVKTEFPPITAKLGLTAASFGAGFSIYLFSQTTYVIGAICLYCVAVWFASFITFSEFLHINLSESLRNTFPFKPTWALGVVMFFTVIALIYFRYQTAIQTYFF